MNYLKLRGCEAATLRGSALHALCFLLRVLASPTVPLPFSSNAFNDISDTFQHIPTVPIPLFPLAPIVPETWVPCWLSSNGSLSFHTKS